MLEHDATFAWKELERTIAEFHRSKIMNGARRRDLDKASLGPELRTIEEVYLRLHAMAYPYCHCGPRCWRSLTESVYTGVR
uniref:Uncharacterized protein n=1 Tax=viral metagenome TaxID=1070528 RepID=A0A6H1ZRH5_9ZZZZ